MKKFIFNIALFLAGVIGVFGTLTACCGASPGVSNALRFIDRGEEIALLIFCVAVMLYGLIQCIIELKKEQK